MKRSVNVLLSAFAVCVAAGIADQSYAKTTFVRPGEKIQAAIDAASNGDIIIVHKGRYTGFGNYNIDFKGKAITLRSESGYGTCIIDCEGDIANRRRAFYFHSGEGATSKVQGFTIRRGYLVDAKGAGILCTNGSSPTIASNLIIGNSSYGVLGVGGGIACMSSSPTITNNSIIANEAEGSYGGGGIYCDSSYAVITGNSIYGNNAMFNDGGGIYTIFGGPTVTNNSIIENDAMRGAGMCNWVSAGAIVNNLFAVNEADLLGGGLYCRGNPAPAISNNTFTENYIVGAGGGGEPGGQPTDEGPFGRELCFAASTVDVSNSIIWHNDRSTGIAKWEPPIPVVKVQGQATISENARQLSDSAIPDFTDLDPAIDITTDVVIITNSSGEVADGTYEISMVTSTGVVLAEPAGTPGAAGSGDIGTADYEITQEPCDDTDIQAPEDEVLDIAVLRSYFYGADVASRVRMWYCIVSKPPWQMGGIYLDGGCSISLYPDYSYWLEPNMVPEEMFAGPGYLYDYLDTPCDPEDDAWVDGWNWHLISKWGRWPGWGVWDEEEDGEWEHELDVAPGIDWGDANSDYSKEPFPNGHRINLGAYGGTVQASKSNDPAFGPAIIIDGLADDVTAGTTMEIEVSVQHIAGINAIQTVLTFLDPYERPYGGFLFNQPGGDSIDVNVSLISDPAKTEVFKVYTGGRKLGGFILSPIDPADPPAEYHFDVTDKTLLMTLTYAVPADAEPGIYQIDLDPYVTFLGGVGADGNPIDISYQDVSRGFFEVVEPPRPWCPDVNGDGVVNIVDMIAIRNKLNQSVSSGNNASLDVNFDGRINIIDLIYVRNKLNIDAGEVSALCP